MLTSEELLVKSVAILSSFFNTNEELLKEIILDFHCKKWKTDAFSLGAYSYPNVGYKQAKKNFLDPEDNTIFYAGEAFAIVSPAGTVEGAIESSEYMAKKILKGK